MSGIDRFARLMLSYPVLWDPSDFNYRDKTIKERVRQELLVQVNRISTYRLTMSDLKRRIRSYCSNRRRRMNRWEHSMIMSPSQCKAAQQQHSKLSHTRGCVARQLVAQRSGAVWACRLPFCRTMKGLLNHMVTCNAGDLCTTPDCTMSKNILNHWKYCRKEICPLCSPQKEWNKTMTTIHRNHIVDIMLQSFSSNSISPAITDQLAYVKRKESDVFKTANSRYDYYRVLAEKLCQFEIENKRLTERYGRSRRSVRV